jgi:hypothetical protein
MPDLMARVRKVKCREQNHGASRLKHGHEV